MLLGLGMLAVIPLSACGKQIGDECKVALDCQGQDDNRNCDISQPGGYCTVEGCDERSCPEESACIQFYPWPFLTKECNPAAPTACTPDEICLSMGRCAPRATERRYCAYKCDDSGDCRDGYECRVAGTLGSMALTTSGGRINFCAPRAQ